MMIHTGREIGGDTTDTEGTTADDPQWANSDLGTGRGGKGGRTDAGLGRGIRHAARGSETSGGG